jgi:hypothetical protein
MPRPRPATIWSVLIVLAAVLVVFGRSLRHEFLDWDDQVTLRENPSLNPPSVGGLAAAWISPRQELYIPVTYTLWTGLAAIAYEPQQGLSPVPYRVASVVLHAAASVLVLLLLLELGIGGAGALIGALLFAVHPLQVEAVGWTSGQKDLLCAALSLGALLAAAVAGRADSRSARLWTLASATLLYALALLAKPSAVVLPLALVAIHLGMRRPWRQIVPLAALWLLLAVPAVVVTSMVQPAADVPHVPLWARPLIAGHAVAFYLAKLVLPIGLTVDYGLTPMRMMAGPAVWIAWLVPAALLGLAWWTRRRSVLPLMAAALFIVPLLPVLGLAAFSFQVYSTVADHYVYLAMLGPALLFGAAVGTWPRLAPAAGVALVILAAMSIGQVRHWRNTDALFAHALEVNPRSLAAHNVLAYRASRLGQDELALTHLAAALEINPRDATARYNAGNALVRLGRLEDAAEQYRLAADLRPDDPLIHANLGLVLAKLGRTDEADGHLRRALEIAPQLEIARQALSDLTTPSSTRPATAPAGR